MGFRPPRLARSAAVVLAALSAGCAGPSPSRPAAVPAPATIALADSAAVAGFADVVDSLRRAAHIPGLSVAVVRDGRVVLARGFGYASVEARVPATADTPYDVASVTKPLAAVVALQLVARGRLDLDRPMRTYARFAEFCAEARREGGLFFGDYACDHPAVPLTLRHVLGMTANAGTPAGMPTGAPGTRFFYNPVSYSWASRPMAEVGGAPFSALVDSLVFRPAGMTRSARVHRALPLRPDLAAALAVPYAVDSASGRPTRATPPPPQGDGAAGGVISTAADLARFDVALDAGRLLPDSLRARLWAPARAPDGAALPYGLGWFVQDVGGRRVVWHTGLWEGRYSALYLKVPAERVTLVLLANSDGLRWPTPLDRADVLGSPFARALLASAR